MAPRFGVVAVVAAVALVAVVVAVVVTMTNPRFAPSAGGGIGSVQQAGREQAGPTGLMRRPNPAPVSPREYSPLRCECER